MLHIIQQHIFFVLHEIFLQNEIEMSISDTDNNRVLGIRNWCGSETLGYHCAIGCKIHDTKTHYQVMTQIMFSFQAFDITMKGLSILAKSMAVSDKLYFE